VKNNSFREEYGEKHFMMIVAHRETAKTAAPARTHEPSCPLHLSFTISPVHPSEPLRPDKQQ